MVASRGEWADGGGGEALPGHCKRGREKVALVLCIPDLHAGRGRGGGQHKGQRLLYLACRQKGVEREWWWLAEGANWLTDRREWIRGAAGMRNGRT